MSGSLSNLFASDDTGPHSNKAEVPASSLDQDNSDDGDGMQSTQSFDDGSAQGDSYDGSGGGYETTTPGAPSDGWLESQSGGDDASGF